MDLINDPSKRRLLVVLLTGLLAGLQTKLGLSQDTLDMLIGLAMTYVGSGNIKDAVVKSAEAKGKSAAESVTAANMRSLILAAIAAEKGPETLTAGATNLPGGLPIAAAEKVTP